MNRQLMRSTQIAVTLSINVFTTTGNDARLVTLPILPLTSFFFTLWAIGQAITGKWAAVTELAAAVCHLSEALAMAAAVYLVWAGIIGRSLAFGLGVRL